MTSDLGEAIDHAYRADGRHLWGLCYRMTGSAAEADDLVQETWVRALEEPPADLEQPWRPWLSRAAMALACDALRARRARDYHGSWLPAPAPDGLLEPAADGPAGARYGLAESATLAFLLALERLTPAQRGVLLLRDVYGQSLSETAEALSLRTEDVEATHQRACSELEAYDAAPCRPTAELQEAVDTLLTRLTVAVGARDPSAIAGCFEDDAELWSDANGQFLANEQPVRGAAAISRFCVRGSELLGEPAECHRVSLNHLPAAVFEFEGLGAQHAARHAFVVVPSDRGRVRRLFGVLAPLKLTKLNRLVP